MRLCGGSDRYIAVSTPPSGTRSLVVFFRRFGILDSKHQPRPKPRVERLMLYDLDNPPQMMTDWAKQYIKTYAFVAVHVARMDPKPVWLSPGRWSGANYARPASCSEAAVRRWAARAERIRITWTAASPATMHAMGT